MLEISILALLAALCAAGTIIMHLIRRIERQETQHEHATSWRLTHDTQAARARAAERECTELKCQIGALGWEIADLHAALGKYEKANLSLIATLNAANTRAARYANIISRKLGENIVMLAKGRISYPISLN